MDQIDYTMLIQALDKLAQRIRLLADEIENLNVRTESFSDRLDALEAGNDGAGIGLAPERQSDLPQQG